LWLHRLASILLVPLRGPLVNKEVGMPIISAFYGIIIHMYYVDNKNMDFHSDK